MPVDSDQILDGLDDRIVEDQVVGDTFDIDDALLTIAVVLGAILAPIVEEHPEAGAIGEKIATADNAETPSNLALWLAVAVSIARVVVLRIQTVNHVSLIIKSIKGSETLPPA